MLSLRSYVQKRENNVFYGNLNLILMNWCIVHINGELVKHNFWDSAVEIYTHLSLLLIVQFVLWSIIQIIRGKLELAKDCTSYYSPCTSYYSPLTMLWFKKTIFFDFVLDIRNVSMAWIILLTFPNFNYN